MKFREWLLNNPSTRTACQDALDWIGDRTFREAWDECPRPEWMLWLCGRMDGNPGWPTRQQIVLLACESARSVIDLTRPEDREVCLASIVAAEAWSNGTGTAAAARAAAFAAYAAADAAYEAAYEAFAARAAADAAAYAADAAVCAAACAAANAAALAACAAYAADAAACAAARTAARTAAYEAYDAAYAARAAARTAAYAADAAVCASGAGNHKDICDLIRSRIDVSNLTFPGGEG